MLPDSFPSAIAGDHRGSMLEVPIAAEVREPLIAFWEALFGVSFAEIRPIMCGDERSVQKDLFWCIWNDNLPQATCHLTIDGRQPILGGLGEVATAVDSRGRGLAGSLCLQAKSTFLNQGGRALFLGTVNPAAERVYRRLGWHSISGTHVMVLLKDHASPTAFLDDYFQRAEDQDDETPINIRVIDAGERVAIIPLILYPHSEFLLDSNLNLYSPRYTPQKSCMSLFGKYSNAIGHNRGIGFAARNRAGRTVGLATAKFNGANGAQIDGFAHPHFPDAWDQLVKTCLSWCKSQHRCCRAEVARRDTYKLARFEKLGFRLAPQQSTDLRSVQDATPSRHDRFQLIIE